MRKAGGLLFCRVRNSLRGETDDAATITMSRRATMLFGLIIASVRGYARAPSARLAASGRAVQLHRMSRARLHGGVRAAAPPGDGANAKRSTGAAAADEEATPADVFAQRLVKVREMRDANVEPFAYSYAPTHRCDALQLEYESLAAGEEATDATVAVCGRVTLKRVFGSLTFLTLADETGTVQLYLDKKRLGDSFKDVKRWIDIGDFVGARGAPKRTDKGELSVAASEWTMLTKCFRPLPDKWHGLTDVSKRYRQRHLDLIVNPAVRKTLRQRAQITSAVRRWLDTRDFLEIETPALQTTPGGAAAKPFQTYHNALEMQLTLRIATELHLKRLLVGGFERVCVPAVACLADSVCLLPRALRTLPGARVGLCSAGACAIGAAGAGIRRLARWLLRPAAHPSSCRLLRLLLFPPARRRVVMNLVGSFGTRAPPPVTTLSSQRSSCTRRTRTTRT